MNGKIPDGAQYLKVREVAADLRVALMTVYRMIERGELIALRLGDRVYRIPLDEYQAYKARLWTRAEAAAGITYPVIEGQTEIEAPF